jgi:hypothetical protein
MKRGEPNFYSKGPIRQSEGDKWALAINGEGELVAYHPAKPGVRRRGFGNRGRRFLVACRTSARISGSIRGTRRAETAPAQRARPAGLRTTEITTGSTAETDNL